MKVDESTKWELAMKDEIDLLTSNQTRQLTELLKEKKALQNKLVYLIKKNMNQPQRYSFALYYILSIDRGELENYEEMMKVDESTKWELAMKDEIDLLTSNQTQQLTKLPKEKKALQNKLVYRIKEQHDSSKRYKTRLVVKGFQQKEGIDDTEIFSPEIKLTIIRVVLGLVAKEDLQLEQLDVKATFLHGDLKEETGMQQPQDFEVQGKERMVDKLQKSYVWSQTGSKTMV